MPAEEPAPEGEDEELPEDEGEAAEESEEAQPKTEL